MKFRPGCPTDGQAQNVVWAYVMTHFDGLQFAAHNVVRGMRLDWGIDVSRSAVTDTLETMVCMKAIFRDGHDFERTRLYRRLA